MTLWTNSTSWREHGREGRKEKKDKLVLVHFQRRMYLKVRISHNYKIPALYLGTVGAKDGLCFLIEQKFTLTWKVLKLLSY